MPHKSHDIFLGTGKSSSRVKCQVSIEYSTRVTRWEPTLFYDQVLEVVLLGVGARVAISELLLVLNTFGGNHVDGVSLLDHRHVLVSAGTSGIDIHHPVTLILINLIKVHDFSICLLLQCIERNKHLMLTTSITWLLQIDRELYTDSTYTDRVISVVLR